MHANNYKFKVNTIEIVSKILFIWINDFNFIKNVCDDRLKFCKKITKNFCSRCLLSVRVVLQDYKVFTLIIDEFGHHIIIEFIFCVIEF
uniref:Uncharacterized protein n=1 Tax=Chrysodeixis chalcites nucleopolyhedrovirus TaxID=320432 RepID=T1QZB3_9ABAC|nr:hypothetical protein [Chrysodeixis chalcites nucleopolyhedrovirus]AGE61559.1 hypothetical protein [Chrysodeixis chalcites nucleopolyhedrovirus]